MAYNLVVTEHADKLLDNILHYLLYQLKNKQAAKHLLDDMIVWKKIRCNFHIAGIDIWQIKGTMRL